MGHRVPKIYISDTTRRVSFEQRLRKYRTLVALMLEEMDDALKAMEQERKQQEQNA